MLLRIEQDHRRFRQIVRGQVQQGLGKYLRQGELIGRQGKEFISIPIPSIDLPTFRYGENASGGVGAGEGEVGEVVGSGEPKEATGSAGNEPGTHILEVEIRLEELMDLLAETLELPNIQPKGKKEIEVESRRYASVLKNGPESLRHFRRTYREALKRQIAAGEYAPAQPKIVPIKTDKRYRYSKTAFLPQSNAAVFYLMDVSGSMGDQQKETVRIESYWIDRWLKRQYKGVESRFIIHDATAKEVDEQTFFHTRESGGTLISSAYRCALEILDRDYPWSEWNVYIFQFSDGDNWAGEDTLQCLELLQKALLPNVNLFAYGQVKSPYGSGQYLKSLNPLAQQNPNLRLSSIEDEDSILESIQTFLGKGL